MSASISSTYVPSFVRVSTGPYIMEAIGRVPELKTVGVVLVQDGRVEELRAPDSGAISVVVELRPRVDTRSSTRRHHNQRRPLGTQEVRRLGSGFHSASIAAAPY
jgi:hypothetical protein